MRKFTKKEGKILKQHIITNQLLELDLKSFIILYKHTRTKTYASLRQISNIYHSMHKGGGFCPATLLKEINIGKMIEILGKYCEGTEFEFTITKDTEASRWEISIESQLSLEIIFMTNCTELVNALWEAVKYTLKKGVNH